MSFRESASIPSTPSSRSSARAGSSSRPLGTCRLTFWTVPLREIASAWQAEEIPSYLSNTAGTYICNQMLYTACRLADHYGLRAGFIHVPPLEHVDLDRQLRAVELALAVLEPVAV